MTSEDRDDRLALAHAARALPVLRQRKKDLRAEFARNGQAITERVAGDLPYMDLLERGHALRRELLEVRSQLKVAERADARLRQCCPGPLLMSEKRAREALRAAKAALRDRCQTLDLAEVGEPDPELMARLERQIAAAEEALTAAEEAHKVAAEGVDIEHERLRQQGARRG